MKVAITGHRPVRMDGQEQRIKFWIEEQLKNLKACYKDIELLDGMAAGVDQIAAKIAINNGVSLKCYFPYRYKLKGELSDIAASADELIWCSENYTGKNVYLDRDRRIVEECDVLLVVWDGKPEGGTYYTYKYAKELGKNIFIYPWGR